MARGIFALARCSLPCSPELCPRPVSLRFLPRLSLPDLVLAAKIDAIEVECSPKWLKEQQQQQQQQPTRPTE